MSQDIKTIVEQVDIDRFKTIPVDVRPTGFMERIYLEAFARHRLRSEAPLRAEIARLREEKIALLHDLAGCPCQRPPGAKGMPLGCCPPCRARRALGDSHVEG